MIDKTKQILKNAVATNQGWVDPRTGELLVSIRGLPDAISWNRKDGLEKLKNLTQEAPVSKVESEVVPKTEVSSPKKEVKAKKAPRTVKESE